MFLSHPFEISYNATFTKAKVLCVLCNPQEIHDLPSIIMFSNYSSEYNGKTVKTNMILNGKWMSYN